MKKKKILILLIIMIGIIGISGYVNGTERLTNDDTVDLNEVQVTRIEPSQKVVISDETKLNLNKEQIEEYFNENYSDISTMSASTPEGCLDAANGDIIGGWAWRPDIPNTSIDVHIYIYRTQENVGDRME